MAPCVDYTTGPPDLGEERYTLSEAARIMGVPLSRLYRERDEYRLRCEVLRGTHRYYVTRSELERYAREEWVRHVPGGVARRWKPVKTYRDGAWDWVLVDVEDGGGCGGD